MARRGSYAKGVAKRAEILESALAVIAAEGYSGASVKRIAESVGLTQAGLLHYFDSKEELLTEVIRVRDQHDAESFGSPDAPLSPAEARESYVRIVRHNSEVPGLVALFSRLAVEAADPHHPAHDYFAHRTESLREAFASSFVRNAVVPPSPLSAEDLARVLQAVSDGLQLQWLVDPSVDMAGTIDRLFAAFGINPPSSGPDPQPPSREESNA